jgi:hypothetical protein
MQNAILSNSSPSLQAKRAAVLVGGGINNSRINETVKTNSKDAIRMALDSPRDDPSRRIRTRAEIGDADHQPPRPPGVSAAADVNACMEDEDGHKYYQVPRRLRRVRRRERVGALRDGGEADWGSVCVGDGWGPRW